VRRAMHWDVLLDHRPLVPPKCGSPVQHGPGNRKIRYNGMKTHISTYAGVIALSGVIALTSLAFAQAASAAGPYKIVKSTQTMGSGGLIMSMPTTMRPPLCPARKPGAGL